MKALSSGPSNFWNVYISYRSREHLLCHNAYWNFSLHFWFIADVHDTAGATNSGIEYNHMVRKAIKTSPQILVKTPTPERHHRVPAQALDVSSEKFFY
jgi:hypothetical protein